MCIELTLFLASLDVTNSHTAHSATQFLHGRERAGRGSIRNTGTAEIGRDLPKRERSGGRGFALSGPNLGALLVFKSLFRLLYTVSVPYSIDHSRYSFNTRRWLKLGEDIDSPLVLDPLLQLGQCGWLFITK